VSQGEELRQEQSREKERELSDMYLMYILQFIIYELLLLSIKICRMQEEQARNVNAICETVAPHIHIYIKWQFAFLFLDYSSRCMHNENWLLVGAKKFQFF